MSNEFPAPPPPPAELFKRDESPVESAITAPTGVEAQVFGTRDALADLSLLDNPSKWESGSQNTPEQFPTFEVAQVQSEVHEDVNEAMAA